MVDDDDDDDDDDDENDDDDLIAAAAEDDDDLYDVVCGDENISMTHCYHTRIHDALWYAMMIGLQIISIIINIRATIIIMTSSYYHQDIVIVVPCWRHQTETISALLALCEGNPPVTGGWIPLTKANEAKYWCFLWSAPEQTVK